MATNLERVHSHTWDWECSFSHFLVCYQLVWILGWLLGVC